MNASGWIQLLLFIVAIVLITKPMGLYLIRVLDPDREGAWASSRNCSAPSSG